MSVAVTSGTFDVLHAGHLEFLRTCHSLLPPGGRLYVFLTTDELAARQKRETTFDYEHRRSLLAALPWVTQVLAHNGDSKLALREKFPFDTCFIGEEYKGAREYEDLKEAGVKVVFVPDPHNRAFSSSKVASDLAWKGANSLRIIAEGTCGSVMVYDSKPVPVVIKTVRISQREFENARTADVYNLPFPRPRNLKKKGAVHNHPMLPGVNSYREIDIQSVIAGQPWCTTLGVKRNFECEKGASTPDRDDFSHIKADKAEPRAIYFIYQGHGGRTLDEWLRLYPNRAQLVVDRVRAICEDLKTLGVVHGDLHSKNICVRRAKGSVAAVGASGGADDWEVSVIDWGWCAHRSFFMSRQERADYERQLADGWDWHHFVDSMEYAYGDEEWFAALRF